MKCAVINVSRTWAIGFLVILMLSGCSSVNKASMSQKYENSKSWIKEKWNSATSRSSSSDEEKTSDSSPDQKPGHFQHKVQWRGETLSLIAKWYTGQYGNWKALAEANPDLNPNRINIGDRIHIPLEMMKTKEPLPLKYVAKSSGDYFSHTVRRSGEKLAEIAEWYTGSADNSRRIAEANPDIDAELLLVGNEIFIPADLIKTHVPMHKKAIQVSASNAASKPLVEESAAPAAEKKKMQLFGPRQFPAE
jgi:hypothetical protein